MKAVAGDLPPGDGWAYEIKWDGMRVIAYLNDSVDGEAAGRRLRLETTRGHDAADRFPELGSLADAVAPLPAILDGEIVVFDEEGRPSFELLQPRIHVFDAATAARRAAEARACYIVFDLLYLDGHELTDLPYLNRRQLLGKLLDDGDAWQISPHQLDDGALLLAAARGRGLEGVIAKRQDSLYRPGRRSPSWVKVKVRNRQEFVVGGWMPGAGNRTGQLGSLLVGYYSDGGALHYAGRVGTGFSSAELTRLGEMLASLDIPEPPFQVPPEGLPPEVARQARWVRPELVAEVAFGHWTREGILRHSTYLGLRPDKSPVDVVRET